MHLRFFITLFLVLCCVSSATDASDPEAEQSVGFQVIVHADNPVTSLERRELSRILLRRSIRWRHGEPILAVDQQPDSAVRDTFSMRIHGKRARTVQHFWTANSNCGIYGPPELLSSDEEVLAFVREHPGAIGYVSADAKLGSGVKALRIASAEAGR